MTDRSSALRISRLLSVLATLLLVAIIVYAGAAVYSATRIRLPQHGSTSATVEGGNTLVLGSNVTIANPGPFMISGVTIQVHLALDNGTAWIASASGPFDIGPYANSSMPITLEVPFGALTGAAADLLVNDAKLPYELWANGSYAGFATWSAEAHSNYSWGAPFNGLIVHGGAPTVNGNGTVGVPVGISFANHAPLDLDGTLALVLSTGDGAVCGTGALPITVGSHRDYSGTMTVYAPAGCADRISSYAATWTGNGITIPLPEGSLP